MSLSMLLIIAVIVSLLVCIIFFFAFRLTFLSIFLFVFVLIFILHSCVFILYEGSQAVVTQFGAIVGSPYTKAGLYLKFPFIWKVNFFDKRLYTEYEQEVMIPTKEDQVVAAGILINWKINNPSLFLSSLPTIVDAKQMIRNLIDGEVRTAFAGNNLLELVRYTNAAYNSSIVPPDLNQRGSVDINKQVLMGRDIIMQNISKQADQYMEQYGVQIVQVLIDKIEYMPEVEPEIYKRMRYKQRQEISEILSKGYAQAQSIKGDVQLEYQRIVAPAIKEALLIKGQADAEATQIYAQSYQKDPHFYRFLRTLEIYGDSLPKKSEGILLSTGLPFFSLLNDAQQDFSVDSKSQVNELEKINNNTHSQVTTNKGK